ncbi:PD-(D/E)XK nuclease domain-containing protein, partial [Cysteiniphilum marinum]|uniref:PD-(D/E)XK nuclease domain-containing protein n=1 Tax=Cysteiniphilum marinum TaxID=2774191 RepID=UPI00193A6A02
NNPKNDLGIVMEFKHAKEDNSQNLNELADKALAQVRHKNYIAELTAQPQVKRILCLGLAFNHKQVVVKDCWQ